MPRQHIKNLDSILKRRGPYRGPYSQSYGFSSTQVWMWELDHKEDWAPKNWCFWTVVLEKISEGPVDSKEIKPGNQIRIFIGRPDAEAPILWPPDSRSWFIMKSLWFWERLKARGEGDNRGWDDWMASPTPWTWVWAISGSPWGSKESDTT